MIYIVGDVHGAISPFRRLLDVVDQDDLIIQVGDFGFCKELILDWEYIFQAGYPCPVYVIDGNHEDFGFLDANVTNRSAPHLFCENLYYVPRGYVTEIQRKRIGFLGGGESVDKFWREEHVSWWRQERITDADVDTLVQNAGGQPLDVLITHVPPTNTIAGRFGKINKKYWNLPDEWEDVSAEKVQLALAKTNPRYVYCGHMHKTVHDGAVRVLDVNEILPLDK